MSDDNQPPGQQAQSDEPFFPVVEAVILERHARPGKHLFGILEAEAMLWRRSSGSSLCPIRTSFSNVALFVVTRKRCSCPPIRGPGRPMGRQLPGFFRFEARGGKS
jgi:hypothetical protein